MGEITLGRLSTCTFDEALLLHNRGFEGYYQPMSITMQKLIDSFGRSGVSPEHSVVAFMDGKPAGFVFLAVKTVRGKKWAWNGGTGVFPEYRGMGIAKAMMMEVNDILTALEVDTAMLAVVTKNAHAIAAYERGGFQIIDRLVGINHRGAWDGSPIPCGMPEGWRLRSGIPMAVSEIPFYQELRPWAGQWHTLKDGESILIFDDRGEIAAYALFIRNFGEDGGLVSIYLVQCEVAPERQNREEIFRIALNGVFGPWDQPCERFGADLSASNPELLGLLAAAGFEQRHEQYLMMRGK